MHRDMKPENRVICARCSASIALVSATTDGQRAELRSHGWMDTVPRPGKVGGLCPEHAPMPPETLGAVSRPLPGTWVAENENAGPTHDDDVEEHRLPISDPRRNKR